MEKISIFNDLEDIISNSKFGWKQKTSRYFDWN